MAPLAEDWIYPETALHERVMAFTTTRAGGFSQPPYHGFNLAAHVGDDPHAVQTNRQTLMAVTGLRQIQWLDQVHGTGVVKVDHESLASVPAADAAWTDLSGVGLAILTADCLPVVLAADDGSVVGVAHAGWRGLLGGVIERLLQAMPGGPGNYSAWVGPAISQPAYEVGEEIAEEVRRQSSGKTLIRGRAAGKFQLDLPGLAMAKMADLGVPARSSCGICAFADARTYSYRRDGTTGRMATLAWLR
jgi:YfiH family protein